MSDRRHDVTDPNAPLGMQCGDAACRDHGVWRFCAHRHVDEEEAVDEVRATEHAHVGGDRYHHHENERYVLGVTALGRRYQRVIR